MKISQFVYGKIIWKGLKICTYMFLDMPMAMHFSRTLCDKYFLSYVGFSEHPLTKNENKSICTGIKCSERHEYLHM